MYIDVQIRQSRLPFWVRCGFCACVLVLGGVAEFLGWQLALLFVVIVCCLWLDRQNHAPIFALSATDPKELWQLGMYAESERQLWQGYLHRAVNLGIAVELTFFVVVPFEKKHTVIIAKHALPKGDFCALTTLAKLGGF